jgi:DNA-binding NtrC family response regulator
MQDEVSTTQGKDAVIVVRDDEERTALTNLLQSMGMHVFHASTRNETIIQLEDHPCDFLLIDMKIQDDVNALALLGKLRESVNLDMISIIVISDESIVVPVDNITVVVRPVAITRLRVIISNLFEARYGSR